MITMSGRVADSQPGNWFWLARKPPWPLVVSVVRDAADLWWHEVDVGEAGALEAVPQQRAPAAG
jgi:hypothetical protein